jgi:hypothetical protein
MRRASTNRPLPVACVLAVLLLAGAAPAAAQQLRGRVVLASSDTPVVGG